MSSFMVGPKTRARILAWLQRYRHGASRQGDRFSHCAANFAEMVGVELDDDNHIGMLDYELYRVNRLAVFERYGDLDMVPEFERATNGERVPSHFQMVKTLSCYLYQCAEGHVPETDFYKAVETLRSSIALAMVYSMPEYDAAEWG